MKKDIDIAVTALRRWIREILYCILARMFRRHLLEHYKNSAPLVYPFICHILHEVVKEDHRIGIFPFRM